MFKSKKILAVVPARGGSKGIPLKNLKKINGKSLIQITSECIQKCSYIDHSVISSDYDDYDDDDDDTTCKNIIFISPNNSKDLSRLSGH